MRIISLAILLVIWSSSVIIAAKPVGIRVFPEIIDLTYAKSIQRITVQTVLSDGTIGSTLLATPNIQFLDDKTVEKEKVNKEVELEKTLDYIKTHKEEMKKQRLEHGIQDKY